MTATSNNEGSASAPLLTDPESCGEDLAFNLRAVGGLAKKHCVDCERYHFVFVAKIMVPSSTAIELDRKEMAATIGALAEEQLSLGRPTLEIVIAGSADTGQLATAAHAVSLIGDAALSRSRFTVLDRCRTPLELCSIYGRRHRLAVSADVVDLVPDQTPRSADIVVVHSLLRYLPKEAHVDILRKFAQWLRPNGRIVFSTKLEDDAEKEALRRRHSRIDADVRRAICSGQSEINESVEAFDARMTNRSVESIAAYDDMTSLTKMFDQADVPILSTEIIEREVRLPDLTDIRRRAVVVLGPPLR